jgi:hypothetical protein
MISLEKIDYKGKGWPTREQELLLKAALFSGETALNSWEKWITLTDFNKIDSDSYRLLPLAVHNLEEKGMNDPFLDRFRGLKKKTWFKNQILFKSLRDILISFHSHGIKTIVLKGSALIPLYFNDLSIRPQNDVDILIPTDSVLLAVSALEDLGWKIKGRPKKRLKKEILNVRDSISFEKGKISALDLHWHAVRECVYPEADLIFWKYARLIKINGLNAYVMSPTEQLYQTCIHAFRHQARWEPCSYLTWISDCIYIMRESYHEIDFNRLLEHAQKHNLILPLRIGLNYLNKKYDAPLPTEFIHDLNKTKVSIIEYKEFKARKNLSGFTGPFILTWYVYLRSIRNKGLNFFSKIWGFVKYLKKYFGLPSEFLIPVIYVFKVIQKLKRAIQTI